MYSSLIQDSQYKRQPFTGLPRLTACTSVMFRTHSTSGSLSTIVHFSLALIIKTQCMRRLHPDYSRCLTLITGRPLGDRSAAPTQESLYITTLVILSMQNNFIVSFSLYEGSSSNSCKLTGLSHWLTTVYNFLDKQPASDVCLRPLYTFTSRVQLTASRMFT